MLTTVPARKRPIGKPNPRVTIEVYPDDEELWHRARIAALKAHLTLREWVMEQVRKGLDGGQP